MNTKINNSNTGIEIPPVEISELNDKIFKNIPKFENIEQLNIELENMKFMSDNAIENYKNILINFTETLISVCGNQVLKTYKTDIIDSINKYPKKIIDTFIIHGYMKNNSLYRKEIIIGNESFFLNESYKEYTNGHPSSVVDYIFQFKTFWNKLNQNNKYIIKMFLLTLCSYADERYIIFNRYNYIKKEYFTLYNKLFLVYDPII